MKILGSYEFNAPPEKVWRALTDPEALCGCIPGCEGLKSVGQDRYEASIAVSIGPIRGKFDAKISMLDQEPNKSYKLVIEGRGTSGFVTGESVVTLQTNGAGTTVQVDGDSQSGGLMARMGQRMIESVAKSQMDRFFNCLREATGA
jgi:carbon monoxide dehydrogenase subunit G